MEFGLGLDPLLDLGVNGRVSLPEIYLSPEGLTVISFALPVNTAATDGKGNLVDLV